MTSVLSTRELRQVPELLVQMVKDPASLPVIYHGGRGEGEGGKVSHLQVCPFGVFHSGFAAGECVQITHHLNEGTVGYGTTGVFLCPETNFQLKEGLDYVAQLLFFSECATNLPSSG